MLGIVVLLLGLLMPGLREVREATRRLQCANHMRAIGTGIVAYSSDHNDLLPRSSYAERKAFHNLMALSVNDGTPAFDGLGLLLPFGGRGYLDNRACFFCPSHCGDHEAERNLPLLIRPGPVRVFGNYHYRGHLRQGGGDHDPEGGPMRLGSHGEQAVLVTDGLRTRSDFNHVKGTNVLRSDISVHWWFDAGNRIIERLPEVPGGEGHDAVFQEFFRELLSSLERTSH